MAKMGCFLIVCFKAVFCHKNIAVIHNIHFDIKMQKRWVYDSKKRHCNNPFDNAKQNHTKTTQKINFKHFNKY